MIVCTKLGGLTLHKCVFDLSCVNSCIFYTYICVYDINNNRFGANDDLTDAFIRFVCVYVFMTYTINI